MLRRLVICSQHATYPKVHAVDELYSLKFSLYEYDKYLIKDVATGMFNLRA